MFREKQIPHCVPRPPNCGGKEKARDSVRDDKVKDARLKDGRPLQNQIQIQIQRRLSRKGGMAATESQPSATTAFRFFLRQAIK
jgi:hypothetical protein